MKALVKYLIYEPPPQQIKKRKKRLNPSIKISYVSSRLVEKNFEYHLKYPRLVYHGTKKACLPPEAD